jgi:hypothetical protein
MPFRSVMGPKSIPEPLRHIITANMMKTAIGDSIIERPRGVRSASRS